jgi:succinyl-diaminopimelate desuccinylase
MDVLEKRLAELTLRLCAVPSVTGNEQALCGELERWARGLFPDHTRRIGNTLVIGRFDDPRPTVALVGHLDTVPGRPEDFPPRLEADRVIGLGSSDMKSGDAIAMALAEDLDLSALPYNLAFIFYDREEGPYEENGLGPVIASMPELARIAFAVILESSDNKLQMACMGSMHGKLTFRGKRAHSARPWQGENAIYKAAGLLSELQARPRHRVEVEGFEYFEVISATIAHGGTARNVIPEVFELNLNYRFAPGKSTAQAESELRALVGDRAEVEIVDSSPAGRVCASNPLYQQLKAITGAEEASKQAWTDVARFAVRGIDSINYGPGHCNQAHQAGEHVLTASLTDCYLKLRRFLETPPGPPAVP